MAWEYPVCHLGDSNLHPHDRLPDGQEKKSFGWNRVNNIIFYCGIRFTETPMSYLDHSVLFTNSIHCQGILRFATSTNNTSLLQKLIKTEWVKTKKDNKIKWTSLSTC